MFNLCKQFLSSTRLGDGSEDRGKGRQEIPDLENSAKKSGEKIRLIYLFYSKGLAQKTW